MKVSVLNAIILSMLAGGTSTTSGHADASRRQVGGTAYGVAAFRAIESLSRDRRSGPFITDKAAEALFALLRGTAPPRWRLMVYFFRWLRWPPFRWLFPISRAEKLRSLIALRTRHIDGEIAAVTSSTTSGLQLVIVGSGLDTRSTRMPILESGRIYELDFEDMHVQKWLQLAESADFPRPPHVLSVGCDLSLGPPKWRSMLTRAGFDASRASVWLLEGLTSYLTATELSLLLEAITELAAPESRLVATFVSATRPRGSIGEACAMPMHRFFTDEPVAVVAGFGPATSVTIGELAARSTEMLQLGVDRSDASYQIVTATRRR